MQSEDFRRMVEHDRAAGHIDGKEWLARWEWADKFHAYNGPGDLLRWMEWASGNKPQYYLPSDLLDPFIRLSEARNRAIVGKISGNGDYPFRPVDENNAIDYLFMNAYPVPDRMKPRRILDFGAGYGRQVNLWAQLHPDLVYTGVDGIESAYCLQNEYYRHFGLPLREYADDPAGFAVAPQPGIYHLPTWRSDLLPDNFYDAVLCVQVLQEINETLVRYIVDEFKRCLKPGGALYIRDHDRIWQPAHHLDVNRLLEDAGFVLEFRPYVVDTPHARQANHPHQPDIHGVPRIWRKVDGAYPPNEPVER